MYYIQQINVFSYSDTSSKVNCDGLIHTHTHTHNNCYLTVIGVHEMHGRMYPNYCQITILLVVDLLSSLAYFMMTHPLSIASKLPINLWLLGNYQHTYTLTHTEVKQENCLYTIQRKVKIIFSSHSTPSELVYFGTWPLELSHSCQKPWVYSSTLRIMKAHP